MGFLLEYDNVTLFITDLLNDKTVKVNAMHRIILSEGSNFDNVFFSR